MTGRRPNSTLVWNFFNSFREAQCPDTVVGEYLEGTPIAGASLYFGRVSLLLAPVSVSVSLTLVRV